LEVEMNFYGLAMGSTMILATGLGHILIIKGEYYWGVKWWPGLLALGLLVVIISVLIDNVLLSGCLGILGAVLLWSVYELFLQKKRVERGWFPKNPKRKT
jgi:hypothetical protein